MVTVSILGAGFMGGAHAANYQALGDRVRVKTVCARSADRGSPHGRSRFQNGKP